MRLWLIVGDQILDLDSDPVQSALVADDQVKEFEAFFEREKERLFQALCLVTRNRFEAEELAQDAFLCVYEPWDRVAKMDEPTGYLYRTAMNAFRSWHRRSSHPSRWEEPVARTRWCRGFQKVPRTWRPVCVPETCATPRSG
jgi:DNA-directed RNA polymerase specialized sigma24 family protein